MEKESIISRKISFIIIAIIAVTSLLSVGLYIFQFGWYLSSDPEQWAHFSNYFAGIMMLVLMCVNLFIFTKITTAIADGDGKAQQERQKNELVFRKKMLTIENQQYEVRKFEKMMNNLIYLSNNCYTENDLSKAKNEFLIAENYIEQMKKCNIFNLEGIDNLFDSLFQSISSANQGLKFGYDNNTIVHNASHQISIQLSTNEIIVNLKNGIVSTIDND